MFLIFQIFCYSSKRIDFPFYNNFLKICKDFYYIKNKKKTYMEALVYTFLLIGTLGIIFFCYFFFREPPRMLK
uniref:T protein of photosystem II n=1 Tax=Treubaria triappendiculata TaxID=1755147 RepID=A0A0S2LN56_TRETR|nr:T protein of photosystem II [Treubaria triappendiculata]ALO62650.1 T protein of photosystem II [Treubaria triappendiculata]